MNTYAKTSKKTGGYRAVATVRREYRQAALARQSAHQRVCDLHAAGQPISKAQAAASQADRVFWFLDHEFRRYKAFYK
jgi:hypothetical protein